MDQWWKRHTGVDMGGLTKETIEDLTGCIPLLLDRSVVGTEDGTKIDLTVPELRAISDKAIKFATKIRKQEAADSITWNMYVQPVQCLGHLMTNSLDIATSCKISALRGK